MDFTAFDFETANRRSDSACQLGAIVVRGGQVVGRHLWMIRPRPFFFHPGNIRIHGIHPQQVADEWEFDEQWDAIWEVLQGACLVAHNAPFDIRVLRACLGTHEIPIPRFAFQCTRLIARQTWPHWQGFGLAVLAQRLGIRFRHHDALEDADACAQVLLAAAMELRVDHLEELEQALGIERGRGGAWGYQGARRAGTTGGVSSRWKGRRRADAPDRTTPSRSQSRPAPLSETPARRAADASCDPLLDLERLQRRAEVSAAWSTKHVVFTGVLRSMQRYQAEALAEALGATCQASVSRKTSVVVIGEPDRRTLSAGRRHSVKEEDARQRAREGQAIELISERDFLRILAGEEGVSCAAP